MRERPRWGDFFRRNLRARERERMVLWRHHLEQRERALRDAARRVTAAINDKDNERAHEELIALRQAYWSVKHNLRRALGHGFTKEARDLHQRLQEIVAQGSEIRRLHDAANLVCAWPPE